MRTFTVLFVTSMTLAAPLAARAAATDRCGRLLLSTPNDELISWLQLDLSQLDALRAIRHDATSRTAAAALAVSVLSAEQRAICISTIEDGTASSAKLIATPTLVVQHSPSYVQRPLPWRVRRHRTVVVNRRPIRRTYARSPAWHRRVIVRRAPQARTVHRSAPTYRPAPTVRRAAPSHRVVPAVYRAERRTAQRSIPAQSNERRGRR